MNRTGLPESDEHAPNEEAHPQDAGAPVASNGNGDTPGNTPYQPAIAAGISEEWDRKNARRLELIELQERRSLTAAEEAEFAELQDTVLAYFNAKFPRRLPDEDLLDKLERQLLLGGDGTKTP
jgi:hypothetical protein